MQLKRVGILLLCLCLLAGCGNAPVPAVEYTRAEEMTMTVALTFDDGPNPTYTPELLDGLKERGIHATFFLVGTQVEEFPELAQRIAREGHQIGNHTYDHADLQKLTEWEAKQDLKKNDAVLQETIGKGTYWIRPPYGSVGKREENGAEVPLINWSVDTEDWKEHNVERILDIIYRELEDGGIILMHDRFPETVEAALQAVDHLTSQGVKFVTVEELFDEKEIEPEKGKVYRMVK